MSKERLDKILSSQAMGSRKEVNKLIKNGYVRVNEIVSLKADQKVDVGLDDIKVNGKSINFKRYDYIMLNKPSGVVSARRDNSVKTVIDLVPEKFLRRNLFPAGRLDKDTEGLLIITDDGEFAHKMLSPKAHVYKLYEASVKGDMGISEIEKFKNGIRISEQQSFLPADLFIISSGETSVVRVRVREGKFHQIKRMFKAVGSEVLSLKRLSIGGLELDGSLKPGECRLLTDAEKELVFRV